MYSSRRYGWPNSLPEGSWMKPAPYCRCMNCEHMVSNMIAIDCKNELLYLQIGRKCKTMQFWRRDLRTMLFNPGRCAHFRSHLLVHRARRIPLSDFVSQGTSKHHLGRRAITLVHMDGNADVELALQPSDCVLHSTSRRVNAAEVVSRDSLDSSPVTPENLEKLQGTVRTLEPREDVAFIFLCGFECEGIAIGDGQCHAHL